MSNQACHVVTVEHLRFKKDHHGLLNEVHGTGLLKRKIRKVNISMTIVSRWSAEVPRTP